MNHERLIPDAVRGVLEEYRFPMGRDEGLFPGFVSPDLNPPIPGVELRTGVSRRDRNLLYFYLAVLAISAGYVGATGPSVVKWANGITSGGQVQTQGVLQETGGVYFVDIERGEGVDAGDLSGFACFDEGTGFIDPPPQGKARSVPLPDGGIVIYQSADPKVCVDDEHPQGADQAVFVVEDTNPDVSPGFSVSP
ncbi:MAG: hypothetical protein HYS86_02005 [Candidatus Chisholmbacteria bacterium]|nr:hypothetical protein [Candidatus Chisholmbacteria bacterium]